MTYVRFPAICLAVLAALTPAAWPLDLAVTTEPYLQSSIYTNPVLPLEGDPVKLGVEVPLDAAPVAKPVAQVRLFGPDGPPVVDERVELVWEDGVASAEVEWQAGANGLYRLEVVLDPDKAMEEDNETNNSGSLIVPVVIKERPLFFPWYRATGWARWCNVVTSIRGEDAPPVRKRGIKALAWQYGGFSWSYFDDTRFDTERDKAMAELEEHFYGVYAKADLPSHDGMGIDEIGGYPESAKHLRSIASMKGLVRAREECPDRFYAVWYGGGTGQTLARLCRESVDLLLLESYLWRAIPEGLGTESIYQILEGKLEPIIRGRDMLVPAYGNKCHTLVALETSERPDWIDLGEQEQVIRFLRRLCPEMRGIAFYNGGYGKYGLERSDETDQQHEAVVRNADRLCFEYFIKPCVTLQPKSLWIREVEGEVELTAAVSNIGGMDAGPVTVRFLNGDEVLDEVVLEGVPAGPNRIRNRAMAKTVCRLEPGNRKLKAQIVSAPGATVLDGEVVLKRFIP